MATKLKKPITTVGRRKKATARIRLQSGTGKIVVNDKKPSDYFKTEDFTRSALSPIETLGAKEKFDISINANGGGLNGQAGAVRLGIARALEKVNPEDRKALKKEGHLKRDPRSRERKKSGQPGARKRFQFSKR